MSDDELRERHGDPSEQEEACRRLEAYAGSLSPESALEVDRQEPYVRALDDLEKKDLAGHLSLTGSAVEKVIFDEMAGDLLRAGRVLNEEQRRALNNLVQLEHVGEAICPPPGIAVPDPAWSPRLGELQERIERRKIEMLQPLAGQETVDLLAGIREFLAANWQSEDWKKELADRLGAVRASAENTPGNFLERAAFIGSIRLDSNDAVDLRHHRLMKEAVEAFEKGDPASIEGQRNPYLAGAAAAARRGRDEFAEKQTAEKVRFLREKITQELSRRRMKIADK